MKWQDKYTRKAFSQGFPARSIFKLKELDKKYDIIKNGVHVLDLGCHPGSWAKYAAEKAEKVIGIDLKETKVNMPNVETFVKDVNEFEWDKKFDVIISDMAPNTTGKHELDTYNSFLLCLKALEVADKYIKPNGNLVMKYFQGEEEQELIKECKDRFEFVKAQKTATSRNKSKEMFLVCLKYRLFRG